MRRSMWLALAASVSGSVWVLLTQEVAVPQTGVVSAVAHAGAAGRAAARSAQPLPARWDVPMLEAARRNPFGGDAPALPTPAAAPTPPPKLVVPQQPVIVAAAAPPAPIAAPFGYRYVGRMVDPTGQRVLYVARGDAVVTVQAGTQLTDGYVVDTVSEAAIEFVHTTTQQRHTIAIPPDASATASATSTR